MTAQVTAGQPITVVARSREGGFIPNATFTVDSPVYTSSDLTEQHTELVADGAGTFVFYAPPGVLTVVCTDPIAVDIEPIQVIDTTPGASGLAAVPTDETHPTSPVTQTVTDASLVGAPSAPLPEDQGGALAAVGVDRAVSTEPPAEDPAVAAPEQPETAPEPTPSEVAPEPAAADVPVEVVTTAVPSEPSTEPAE